MAADELWQQGDQDAATAVERHLRRETRPGGSSRTFETDRSRAVRNVHRAIKRAIVTIEPDGPRLAVHLTGAIELGAGVPLMYRPERKVIWLTD